MHVYKRLHEQDRVFNDDSGRFLGSAPFEKINTQGYNYISLNFFTPRGLNRDGMWECPRSHSINSSMYYDIVETPQKTTARIKLSPG